MKKLRYLTIILIFSITLTTLSSCLKISKIDSGKETTTERTKATKETKPTTTAPAPTTTEKETDPTTTTVPSTTAPIQVVTPSDNLYSYQVTLDGKLYQLPVDYSVLAADGWTYDEEKENVTLNPNESTYEYLYKNGSCISVDFFNNKRNVVALDDCAINMLGVEVPYDNSALPSFSLPGGISVDSSYEDVIATYGEPTTYYYSELYQSLYYGPDYDTEVSIYIYEGYIDEILVRNSTPPFDKYVELSNPPAEVASYKKPVTLGTTWNTFTVNYGGDLYSIPAPVTAFLENGWEFMSDPNAELVSAQSSSESWVILRKDNQFLFSFPQNYSNVEQPIPYCFITDIESVHVDSYGTKVPLELPGGITLQSTQADLLAVLGEPDTKYDSEYYPSWTYGENWYRNITIYFQNEDDMIYIESIYVSNDTME